jgi:hypothetical protein
MRAVLISGRGDGADRESHDGDVARALQLNWLAMSTSRVGPVGEDSEHA